MTDLYIDADACPVKAEAISIAERFGVTVHLVSNSGMRPGPHAHVRNVLVAEGPDAADDWIAERAGPADVVVTADIPLAARCIERGAQVLKHNGEAFTKASIGMALAMRDLMQTLRDSGEVRGGGAPYSKADRARFRDALDKALRRAA